MMNANLLYVVKDSWCARRVVGDSMSPVSLDGDIVLMDYAMEPRDGDVVAALIDDSESTQKTYSRRGDEMTLTPIETKRHSPRTFHLSRIAIRGRAPSPGRPARDENAMTLDRLPKDQTVCGDAGRSQTGSLARYGLRVSGPPQPEPRRRRPARGG